MELGHHTFQVFLSVALILTAAVVAFVCDMLKRNNEHLRELNIELKIRQEEDARRAHAPAPRAAKVAEKPAHSVPAPAVASAPIAHMAAPKERSTGKERKRTVNSEALAAMERGAALASTGMRPKSTPAPEAAPVKMAAPKPVAKSEPAPAAKPVKKDWGTLLSRNAQGIKPEPVLTAGTTFPGSLPAGFQDGFVLHKLVQSHQPVSGLVVSIGVASARKNDQAVSKLVASLIGPDDFAAQSSDDEFLLIYPQERGASAQRRLSKIAQQLWDFQLRSLGSSQILFSWGGVEVASESIDEAIASASERMLETKRGRKLLTMESPAPVAAKENQLRQAV